jgi:hypothetical protein
MVPIIKPFELLNLSMKGGFEPCCVNDDSHFGRAILYGTSAGFLLAKSQIGQSMISILLSRTLYDGKNGIVLWKSITLQESHAKGHCVWRLCGPRLRIPCPH